MILNVDVLSNARIPIGKQGENLTTQVVFDCSNWLGELSGGVLSLVHQRPTDEDAYPVGNYTTDATSLTWDINETDLAYNGLGKCELRYTIGERIAKTKTFITEIVKALNPLENPPEAYEPYIDRVIDAATQEMQNMTVSATAHDAEEASASVEKEYTDHEHLTFTFGLPKGDKGDRGVPGQDGDSIGTVSATIDNNTGTPSVVVTQSGGSGSPIDVSLAFHNLKGVSFDTSYLPSDSASGSPATFPDGAKNVNVDSLVADINPVQTGSGTPSPSNPRPITGWSSIDLTHNGTTDTISLGQTVYGGSLNVTTGVLTIDKAQVDMGDLSWGYNTSYDYPYFGTSIPDDNIIYTEGELTIACEIYEALEGRKGGTFRTTDNDGKITTISNGGINNRVALQDSLVTSVPDLKTKVGGYKLIYTLATPITANLTPVQVATVLGSNSIQANSGDVAVSYRADIGLYIDKKLA